MNNYEILSFKDMLKKDKLMDQVRVYCKCGHSIHITRVNKCVCTHCGRTVYKNPQEEFKDKLTKKIKEGKDE